MQQLFPEENGPGLTGIPCLPVGIETRGVALLRQIGAVAESRTVRLAGNQRPRLPSIRKPPGFGHKVISVF